MGAKNLPPNGFPQQQQRDNRPQPKSNNRATLKNVYTNEILNPFNPNQVILNALPSQFWGTPVYRATKDGYMIKAGELYCPGFLGDTFSKNAWDYVEISYLETLGVSGKTPGICTVSVRRGRKVDRKNKKGTDGETVTFTGLSNADIEISIMIWTPEQLDVLTKMWQVLQPPAGKKNPAAWDISHPQFGINSIKSMMFVDSIGLENGPERKTKIFTIKGIQWLPPSDKNATVTPPKAQARNNTLEGSKDNEQPGKNPKAKGPRGR